MIKRNYYKIVRVFPDPSSYFYIKNETMNSVWFSMNDSWLSTVNLEYSFDKVNWTRLNDGFNAPADGYIYLRNTTGTFCTSEYTDVFYINFNCSLGGDIRTLFNYTDVESVTKIPDYGFCSPFLNMGYNITDISNLSFRGITEIGNYGLKSAFSGIFTGTKGVDLRDVTTLGENALLYLYSACNTITEVYAPNVSTWDTNKTSGWLSSAPSTGVIYKPSTLTIPINNDSGLPSGWTTQDYPTI